MGVRSRDCLAVSNLLRNLDVPSRLRQNDLVARCFAGIREVDDAELDGRIIALRIKAIVLASIASLETDAASSLRGSRQRSIMERCDIRREKHSAVAIELGISLREFYRERRRAMERLAVLVRAELARPSKAVLKTPAAFELDLDRVVNLTRVGDMPAAFMLLESVVRAATSARDCVRACCLGVELAADGGDAPQCREFFAEARRAGASLGETHDALIVSTELELGRAMQSWAAGDLTATRSACDNAVRGATRISASGEPEASRLAVTAFLRSATFAFAFEENSDLALQRLGEAGRILDRMAHKPPDLSGEFLISLGLSQWYVDGHMGRSLEYLREAAALLADAQVTGMLPVALRYLCDSFVMVGCVPEGRIAGNSAMHAAKAIGSVQIWVYACLSMAAVELACGNAESALELTSRAGTLDVGGMSRAATQMAAAEAHLALRRFDSALELARDLQTREQPGRPQRIAGEALRIAAEAYEGLGNRAAARECIDAAVAILAKRGNQRSKQRAYACSGRVTGRRVHRALANELAIALRAVPSLIT
jgi:tetratricopeptide (TPR) repeat protein